ncbi:MAG TPA: hypothetical protein VFT72_02800 [Opitutaceae bacterium]|nr:hypothetical protein [Opitutaceae bacterium]
MAKAINRWVIPILVGAGLLGLMVWFCVAYVRLRPPPTPAVAPQKPAIVLVTSENDDRERRELTDLDPLFLPTSHNTSVLSLPPQVRREPGSMSFVFPPKLSELESKGGVAIAETVAVPDRPVEVLNLGTPPPKFNEVGRADVYVPPLIGRMAFIEVADAKTGRIVLSEEIPSSLDVKPPSTYWVPIGFLVAVDAAGIVGSPVLTTTSSSDDVESFFGDFLARKFSLGAKLTPGFYTVHVGP